MGGLEFFSIVPLAFGIIVFCLSMLISGTISESVIFLNKSLFNFIPLIIVYLLGITILIFGPLLIFVVSLIKAKAKGINMYGALLVKHHNAFEQKWLHGKETNEEILGNTDNSSLADINAGYEVVSSMQIFPMPKDRVIRFLIFIALPFLPLYFTVHSISEIMTKISNYIFA